MLGLNNSGTTMSGSGWSGQSQLTNSYVQVSGEFPMFGERGLGDKSRRYY